MIEQERGAAIGVSGGQTAADGTRSVILPVYDEDPSTWERLVDELRRAGWAEVVLAVDAPCPATRERLEDASARRGVVVSTSDERRGKGGALRDGLDAATGDVLGYLDADGAVSVGELDRVYRTVEEGAALAAGSRDVGRETRASQPVSRRALARGYRWLARRVTGVPVQDFQCGAKAFTREAWTAVSDRMTETGFAFDTELVARVHHHGLAVREVSIDWRDPGDSDVRPVRDVPCMFASLARLRGLRSASPENDGPLRVALVTSHPPNRGHLAEYGEELAGAYAARDDVEPTVLARRTEGAPLVEERDGYEVRRIWERDSLRGAIRLCRELRSGAYDVVQFNVHMTYFGTNNAYRFLGLALPPFASRVLSVPAVSTLHDLLEVVEEGVVDETVTPIERAGAYAATQLLLRSDATTVTSEEYLEVVEDRYHATNVHHVPHGTFVRTDGGVPPVEPPFRVMVFGHLSSTKDVATVVEAFERVREHVPDAELRIAGDSHPDYPGYRERLEERYGDRPGVEFTGYVEEHELADVWREASVVVMPYRTCTGVSGVFQLAKSYGRPIVAYDTESMRTSTVGTGGDAEFVPAGDPDAMAERLLALYRDPDRLRELVRANAEAADEHTIADTADRMVDVLAGVAADE
jgi:glycosyltransferase involved in cell wall biosynthesis